jgi:hypothetical protein
MFGLCLPAAVHVFLSIIATVYNIYSGWSLGAHIVGWLLVIFLVFVQQKLCISGYKYLAWMLFFYPAVSLYASWYYKELDGLYYLPARVTQ